MSSQFWFITSLLLTLWTEPCVWTYVLTIICPRSNHSATSCLQYQRVVKVEAGILYTMHLLPLAPQTVTSSPLEAPSHWSVSPRGNYSYLLQGLSKPLLCKAYGPFQLMVFLATDQYSDGMLRPTLQMRLLFSLYSKILTYPPHWQCVNGSSVINTEIDHSLDVQLLQPKQFKRRQNWKMCSIFAQ